MILVLGGAGYIGSHMCRRLRDAGIEHLVFDNLERGFRKAIGDSPFVQGDLRDHDAIRSVFAQHEIDVVMHFAAYIEVGESVREPADFYANNVVAVHNLFEAMRENGISQFVFSSTAAVYGEPQYVPIDEDHPKNPTSPYGDTKLAVERMADAYSAAYGMRAACLRYFNAAGAHPDGEIGEAHNPETHLLPIAILAAQGKRPPLTVFGEDYDTVDGTCVRDYVHVMDLADAHLLAVEHLRHGGGSRKYNLGSGTGFSVRQVIETIEKVTGKQVPYSIGARRAGDPAKLIAKSDRIRTELNWKPNFDDLKTIVQHAWKWHESHPNGYAG